MADCWRLGRRSIDSLNLALVQDVQSLCSVPAVQIVKAFNHYAEPWAEPKGSSPRVAGEEEERRLVEHF